MFAARAAGAGDTPGQVAQMLTPALLDRADHGMTVRSGPGAPVRVVHGARQGRAQTLAPGRVRAGAPRRAARPLRIGSGTRR